MTVHNASIPHNRGWEREEEEGESGEEVRIYGNREGYRGRDSCVSKVPCEIYAMFFKKKKFMQ
jgi:hypothetical protein